MKIFILSPNVKTLLNASQIKQLEAAGDLIIDSEIKPILQVEGILGNEEKILAIDPDFCDWKVDNEVFDKVPNLKAVVLQSTSFSWIDVEYAKKKGVPVVNLRGFSTIAVSEWATMMALIVVRKLPVIVKDGWKQDFGKHQGMELRGKVAGVIGLGRIGKAISENFQGLGMTVQYWSKESKDNRFKYAELKNLLATSDVILPALAQNDATQGMITDEMLKSMKRSAIFVSIVHRVYNHELLLQMVKKGELYGYAFEEINPDITKYEGNVWAGPELAWCTEDSLKKNAQQWVEAIIGAVKGSFNNRVN